MRPPLARATWPLLLVVVIAGFPALARGQKLEYDLGKDPVPVIIRAPKAGALVQATLYQLTDTEVKFKVWNSNRVYTFHASRVEEVETDAVRFVYDPKKKGFNLVVKGKPGGLEGRPIMPREPERQYMRSPTIPPLYNEDQYRDKEDYDKARARKKKALRALEEYWEYEKTAEYARRKKELEEEYQRALRYYASQVEAYQKALKEWQAKENKRVTDLTERINDVEKQFNGKVRFENPIEGHTKDSVEAVRDLVKQAERRAAQRQSDELERKAAEKAAELERKAASYLAYARKLLDQGETEKAHERIREVAEKFPETKAGVEAQNLLKELKLR